MGMRYKWSSPKTSFPLHGAVVVVAVLVTGGQGRVSSVVDVLVETQEAAWRRVEICYF